MKRLLDLGRLLFCLIFVLTLATLAHAQAADTFDIATFRAPAGWNKQPKDGGLLFTTADEKSGAYAMIILYRSQPGSGVPKKDFDADWKQFITDALKVKGTPQMEAPVNSDGWTVTTGGSTFESDLGTSLVILSTYSGFGRRFSAAAVFNNQEYTSSIEAFAASIVLEKTASPAAAPNTVDQSVLGTWSKNLGAHVTYGNPVSTGMAGYSKDQYTLNADGTYTFVSKTFRMSYDKIILIKESGTSKISGNMIAIAPKKSVVEAWSKLNGGDGWGRLLSSSNRKLETVTYRFTKHYFSGIQLWNLVLQADSATDRDGPFSNNKLFENAWYYSPISANNPLIELPK